MGIHAAPASKEALGIQREDSAMENLNWGYIQRGLVALGNGQQIGIFFFKVTPYRLLNNRDHCFSLMNSKQLKGKMIRLFKRKSDSPHCNYAKFAL